MTYKLESYVDTYNLLKDKQYSEIKNNEDLFIKFVMFVSHCFAGYGSAVLNEGCTVCEKTHLRNLKERGYEEAIKADELNSRPYRLKNKFLSQAFWVEKCSIPRAGFNLNDKDISELIENGIFSKESFEFSPGDWFSAEPDVNGVKKRRVK